MNKKLNIIGCGKVGKTLGHLWSKAGTFEIGDIANQTVKSAQSSVDFIGSGQVARTINNMRGANLYLIGTPDNKIANCSHSLATSGLLKPGDIVFHCSGAQASTDLESVKECGAFVASVHPVMSFSDPASAIATFSGTFCGVEGDSESLGILGPAFEAIGGTIFNVDPEQKTIYHAANVIVCNYLTTLLELGTRAFARAGIERDTAMQMMEPLVRGTLDNIFEQGTATALTGPIARGDETVVARQLDALSRWNPSYGELYRDLGRLTLELSQLQGTASKTSLSALAELLDRPTETLDPKE